jgi:sulfite reductase (NADPH) hemoprotein beta-component
MAGGALAFKGPSVPTARIQEAIERVQGAYDSGREGGETFFTWAHRMDRTFFGELLADLLVVAPEDVERVARDHGQEEDFRVLQLGGGECAGVVQARIGTNFYEAAHERNYRDALKFQSKFVDAVHCAAEIARLISQGMTDLLGGKRYDDLLEQAEELHRVLPTKPRLSRQLVKFAEDFAQPAEDLTDGRLTELFSELDAWTMEVAEFCLTFDRQLDLTGALPAPLKIVTRSSAVSREQPSVIA